ncbi:hypothetical protein TNCV_4462491 [Trichonephila clavipes]|nr:hypothetical protein TNCV_4462491 [Trichonephila clavipes]
MATTSFLGTLSWKYLIIPFERTAFEVKNQLLINVHCKAKRGLLAMDLLTSSLNPVTKTTPEKHLQVSKLPQIVKVYQSSTSPDTKEPKVQSENCVGKKELYHSYFY